MNDTIQPISGEYIARAIAEAARRNDQAVLIEMNTPGGMMPPAVFSSAPTRRITTRSCNGRNFIEYLPEPARAPGLAVEPQGSSHVKIIGATIMCCGLSGGGACGHLQWEKRAVRARVPQEGGRRVAGGLIYFCLGNDAFGAFPV